MKPQDANSRRGGMKTADTMEEKATAQPEGHKNGLSRGGSSILGGHLHHYSLGIPIVIPGDNRRRSLFSAFSDLARKRSLPHIFLIIFFFHKQLSLRRGNVQHFHFLGFHG